MSDLRLLVSCIHNLPSAQPEPQNAKIFQGIIVEYPSISTYPECEGKPYFSIKYTEDGQDFIGYGTYKPEVLSEYLKEYFMPSAQPERKTGRWETAMLDHEAFGVRPKVLYCSECNQCIAYPTRYCPNCGASMKDGE